MFSFLDKFFLKIEKIKIDLGTGIAFFFIIVFFRFLLESLLALGPANGFLPISSLLHYFFWYGVSFLFSSLIVSWFSQRPIDFVLKLILIFYPFILFPLLFPLILGESVKLSVSYLYASDFKTIFNTFLNFFENSNFSLSLRLQIFLSLLALVIFVYWSTKKWWRALMAAVISYFLLILAGSLPSFLIIFQNPQKFYPLPSLLDLFFHHQKEILIAKGYFSYLSSYNFNVWLDLVLASLLFPLLILALGLVVSFWKKDLVGVIFKNLRLRKGFDFFLTALLGGGVGIYLFSWYPSFSFINLIALINLFLIAILFYGATAFFDDIFDKEVDILAHPSRPLVSGKISEKSSLRIAVSLAALSLMGAMSVSFHLFLFVLASLFLAFLYSAPPFRLKRFFLINTFLVALAFLFFAWGGFFWIFPEKNILDIPSGFIGFYLLVMMILVSLKDLSDFQGDQAGVIKTLPVVAGLQTAKLILGGALGLLVFLSFLFLSGNDFFLKVWGLIFGGSLFGLTVRKNFSEKVLYKAAVFFLGVVIFYLIIR